MTKRNKAKTRGKRSRRLGVALWGGANDPIHTKNYKPGQHGPTARGGKPSDYGNQLRAKQQLRFYYGDITEKQFRKIFQKASRLKGDAGENLVGLLERRLSMVIYRMNIVPTVFAARQFISHKHIQVNGKTVNIPSYVVKPGDVISVKEKSRQVPIVIEATQKMDRELPEYVSFDSKKCEGTFNAVPTLAEIPYPVVMEPNLVIEYYSR